MVLLLSKKVFSYDIFILIYFINKHFKVFHYLNLLYLNAKSRRAEFVYPLFSLLANRQA